MSEARTICLDIETTPLVGYAWKTWDTDIIRLQEDWHILCCGWKVLGEEETHVVSLTDFKKTYAADKTNDYDLCDSLHDIMSDADVIVAHNGDRFDIRKIQARLLYHGFAPPEPFQTVDTLKIARRHFAFTSNKLDDLGTTLGVGNKVKHPGFDMWLNVMAGDKDAWKLMIEYCRGDVVLLEAVYDKLLPWAIGTPNRALLDGESLACPSCGSKNVQRQGFKKTKTMTYQQFQCQDCGSWSRARIAEKNIDKPILIN